MSFKAIESCEPEPTDWQIQMGYTGEPEGPPPPTLTLPAPPAPPEKAGQK
jgi:hypothetical protein